MTTNPHWNVTAAFPHSKWYTNKPIQSMYNKSTVNPYNLRVFSCANRYRWPQVLKMLLHL